MVQGNKHQPLYVGFAAIARTTFDIALAEEMTRAARAALSEAGLTLEGPEALIAGAEDVEAAVAELAGDPPDVLVIFQATFADSTMALGLAQNIDAPVLLWGVPEARTGGRLRLNSLTGINLAGHALKRAGVPYDYIYAAPDDPAAVSAVKTLAQAGRVRDRLLRTRIARIGDHPAGFETCQYDARALAERFGVQVLPLDLREDLFAQVRTVNQQAVTRQVAALSERVDGLDSLDGEATRGTLAAYLTLHGLAQEHEVDGFAVRCWPEFFTELGCAACGAMSLLSDEGFPASCEADVNGTITQFILQTLSGEPAFGTDVVAVDDERDGLVLWHCGLAPLSMADPDVRPAGTIHSNRRLPLLMEFPLKPGVVTVARLSEAGGEYRLVIGRGEMQRAPRSFSGTSGVVRFGRPARDVLDTILTEGLEHHLSLTYGDHVAALSALAKMLQLPVLRL